MGSERVGKVSRLAASAIPINKILTSDRTFGRLHIHPTSGAPEGILEYHLVYRDGEQGKAPSTKLSSKQWHSDVTYEQQPPGLTTLLLFDTPPSGGDTAYVSQVGESYASPHVDLALTFTFVEAYNRLSPSFREYLETLSVVHSGYEQAEHSRSLGGVVRREPVSNIHPLIRRHPVTGDKALFVNPGFSRRIVGLKDEESDAILNLL
jgi:sulfonate dioxygenase